MLLTVPITEGVSRPEAELPLLLPLLLDPLEELLFEGGCRHSVSGRSSMSIRPPPCNRSGCRVLTVGDRQFGAAGIADTKRGEQVAGDIGKAMAVGAGAAAGEGDRRVCRDRDAAALTGTESARLIFSCRSAAKAVTPPPAV